MNTATLADFKITAMAHHPEPLLEPFRLEKLHHLHLLDSEPCSKLDEIVKNVCDSYGVPTGAISLVDENHQWLLSSQGVLDRERPRESAYCGHTIMSQEPLIISDTYSDDRFSYYSIVSDNPGTRFYAGAPLHLYSGVNIGALYIADNKPREDITNTAVLKEAASEVMKQIAGAAIESHRLPTNDELRIQRSMITDGTFLYEIEGKLSAANHWCFFQSLLLQIDKHETSKIYVDINNCELEGSEAEFTLKNISTTIRSFDIDCEWL